MDSLPNRDATSPVTWRTVASAAVMLACMLLVTASGRVGSSDAGSQLDAAIRLASSGSAHAPEPFGVDPEMWIRSPSGRYYQVHDIGAFLFLIPAAKMGTLFAGAGYNPMRDPPPVAAKVFASLSYSLMAAAGALCFFLLLRLYIDTRRSTLLTLVFVTGTMYWVYSKSAWDVMGGCFGVVLLMLAAATILWRSARGLAIGPWRYAALGAAFAIACSFRYSLLPFLGISLLVLGVLRRPAFPFRGILIAGLAMALGLLPSLSYNRVRTGSFLKPATIAPEFAAKNNLSGNLLAGTSGVLVSPNRGLIWYCPLMLLWLAVPFRWRSLDPDARILLAAFGTGTVGYILMIGKLPNWHCFGWGPRYLVPVLPVLFLPVALVMADMWRRSARWLAPLVVLSVLINAAPVLVNWQLASARAPGEGLAWVSRPVQQMAVWSALWSGLQGVQPDPPAPAAPATAGRDPAVRQFPDLLLARIGERSGAGLAFSLAVAAFGLSVAGGMCRRLLIGGETGPGSGILA